MVNVFFLLFTSCVSNVHQSVRNLFRDLRNINRRCIHSMILIMNTLLKQAYTTYFIIKYQNNKSTYTYFKN